MTTIRERLAAGTAYVDVSEVRAIEVSGSDAHAWLNDLVSADLTGLAPGRSRPSLLLAPTGGIRASFVVVATPDAPLLLQDPGQERSVADLLAPYVLSSDVTLTDRTGELAVFAFPGLADPPAVERAWVSAPSVLGTGSDLVAPSSEGPRIVGDLSGTFAIATADDAEAWRIVAGLPRVGVDTLDGDLPQEASLEAWVSFDKGCFVGQEAVAKTRNLGHPRRLLLPVRTEGRATAGDAVLAQDDEAGALTSVVRVGEVTFAIARVRWSDRDRPLRTAGGAALDRRERSTAG